MPPYPGARTNSTALAAFWIGVLSFFCMFGTGGVVANLSGVLGGGAAAMAVVMLGASLVALAVLALATPAFRRGGAWQLT